MTITHKIGGLILAGGESRRMGRDKWNLPFDGTILLERIIQNITDSVDEVFVITKTPEKFDATSILYKILTDNRPEKCSLAGIYSGISKSPYENNLVLACDIPFVDSEVVLMLKSHLGSWDAIIPKTEFGLEPLCGIYSKSCLPAFENAINQGDFQIQATLLKLNCQMVSGIDPDVFQNINTPEEYDKALKNRF